MKYIIKPFEPKEAIQYPWRVIGAGFVPKEIEEVEDKLYSIIIPNGINGVESYTEKGILSPLHTKPILHLLDIEAMQKHGYEIPDFVLDKEPGLTQTGLDLQKLSDGLERALANETEESLNKFFEDKENAEDIGNFALILDKELRGYVIKYAKLERPDKPLAELVKYNESAKSVITETFRWRSSCVFNDRDKSFRFWENISCRLREDSATKLTDKERNILKNPYHEQNNTEITPIKVKEPKPELNRNEIALKVYCALLSNPNVEINADYLVHDTFNLADKFIKYCKEK